jgi:hypothetical protein
MVRVGSIIRMRNTPGVPGFLCGLKGTVSNITCAQTGGAVYTVVLEGRDGLIDITYDDEFDVIESNSLIETLPTQQINIGDFVRVVPTASYMEQEGTIYVGKIAKVISFDAYQKEKLPLLEFIDPALGGLKRYVWHYEIENISSNLPKGAVRCSNCVETITTSGANLCCDCASKSKPRKM